MSIKMDTRAVDGEGVRKKCEENSTRPNPILAALEKSKGAKNPGSFVNRDEKEKTSGRVRNYKRECILNLRIDEKERMDVDELMDAIEEVCGKSSMWACVPNGGNEFELSLKEESHARVLMPSFVVGTVEVAAEPVFDSKVNVSILNMSTLIPNSAIHEKLSQFGVELISPISERFYRDRDGEITDGTRYFTVKFPENRKSLPYSVRFVVNGRVRHYKVVHNNMQSVCLICSSSDHFARKCPRNKCYSCFSRGHIAQDCPESRCIGCDGMKKWCTCASDREYMKATNDQTEKTTQSTYKKQNEPSTPTTSNEQRVCNDSAESEQEVASEESQVHIDSPTGGLNVVESMECNDENLKKRKLDQEAEESDSEKAMENDDRDTDIVLNLDKKHESQLEKETKKLKKCEKEEKEKTLDESVVVKDISDTLPADEQMSNNAEEISQPREISSQVVSGETTPTGNREFEEVESETNQIIPIEGISDQVDPGHTTPDQNEQQLQGRRRTIRQEPNWQKAEKERAVKQEQRGKKGKNRKK